MPSMKHKPKGISQEDWDAVESPELTSDFIRGMKRAAQVHPEIVESYRRTRGPQKAPTKQQVTLRLDRDVIAHFQQEGAGWQTRINDALLSLIKKRESSKDEHPRGHHGSSGHGRIIDIEGIGPKYANKLKKIGVSQTKHLLTRGASKKGRKILAKESGCTEAQILKWTNMADLMRIRGVGEEYSELLEAAGIGTVNELSKRKPENLHRAMSETNVRRKLVRQLPSVVQLENWVAQAKTLQPLLAYSGAESAWVGKKAQGSSADMSTKRDGGKHQAIGGKRSSAK